MKIGIIGAGVLGSQIARLLSRSGLEATIANRRGPEALAGLLNEVGPSIQAGTVGEAASADLVFLAVRWVELEGILSELPPWNGRIVVDTTNPVAFLEPGSAEASDPSNPLAAYGIKAMDLGGRHSSAIVRALAPGARVVKAFNHLDARALTEPNVGGGRRVLFYSGDDPGAKAEVRKIMDAARFVPVDLGRLDTGGPLATLPFGALSSLNLLSM